tara:strand:+ start:685 stop:1014 length:330 start_codon:yes stop_codon:yes gene_type:complete
MKKLLVTPNNTELVDLTAIEIAEKEAQLIVWNNGALDRALKIIREIRNNFLAETDWMANSDVTMSSAMTTYRQALRDITSGLDTVAKIETKLELDSNDNYKNFPTKPSE